VFLISWSIYRIASIDFCPPVVLSGSSDKHLRLFDMTTLQGWSTSLDYKAVASTSNVPLPFSLLSSGSNNVSGHGMRLICQACGSNSIANQSVSRAIENCSRCVHGDLVRSVALGQDFVLSGSYDLSIKVGPFFSCYPCKYYWLGLLILGMGS
jgi:hypothetical protein